MHYYMWTYNVTNTGERGVWEVKDGVVPTNLKSCQSEDLMGYITIPYSKYYVKAKHECTHRTHI